MIKSKTALGIGVVIVFQLCVLVGVYFGASMPLWTGQQVRIKTVPVDPRSLFRGNYALLRYGISRIDAPLTGENHELRKGEKVYVKLKPAAHDLYEFESASLIPPAEGVFIRGRISDHWQHGESGYYEMKYGIEAYFAPKEKALHLEKQLADGGIAVLMISDSGRAALKNVLPTQKHSSP